MKIVLLESLGISPDIMHKYASDIKNAGHTFVQYERDTDTKTLIDRIGDAEAVIIANMPLKGEVIRECKNLRFIDVAFTGVDHVDLKTARQMGIKVSNASGYSTEAVAELALCMMISLLRNVRQTDTRCRNHGTKDGLIGSELKGKTVGIIGTGLIGMRTAELCHAFGCNILGNRRHTKGNEPEYMKMVSLEELLRQADIVSLHCPLTPETRHLMNKDRIGMMKRGAILINTARGPVTDMQALEDALRNGQLSAAGIDVFDSEPPLADCPLADCESTVLTPHIAFATKESMIARAGIVFDNLKAWIDGKQKNIIL